MPEFGCIDADDMRSIKKKDHAIREIWGIWGEGGMPAYSRTFHSGHTKLRQGEGGMEWRKKKFIFLHRANVSNVPD